MMIPQHGRRTRNVVGNENNYIDHDTPNAVDDTTTMAHVYFMFQEVYDDDTSA